jgi:hypothetical protein
LADYLVVASRTVSHRHLAREVGLHEKPFGTRWGGQAESRRHARVRLPPSLRDDDKWERNAGPLGLISPGVTVARATGTHRIARNGLGRERWGRR